VRYRGFVNELTELCAELAERIVRDGEGATRVFQVEVANAKSARDADRIGRAVAESPLVKTAIHGADPNWGPRSTPTACGSPSTAYRSSATACPHP